MVEWNSNRFFILENTWRADAYKNAKKKKKNVVTFSFQLSEKTPYTHRVFQFFLFFVICVRNKCPTVEKACCLSVLYSDE